MNIKHLNEEVINFDGKKEIYEILDDSKVYWTGSRIIRTLMKNISIDESVTFEDRVLASTVAVKLRDTTEDEVEITKSELELIREAGEKSCHPVLLELFMKMMDSASLDI